MQPVPLQPSTHVQLNPPEKLISLIDWHNDQHKKVHIDVKNTQEKAYLFYIDYSGFQKKKLKETLNALAKGRTQV